MGYTDRGFETLTCASLQRENRVGRGSEAAWSEGRELESFQDSCVPHPQNVLFSIERK